MDANRESATMQGFASWVSRFRPQAILTSRRDRLVACVGAGLGLPATEWLSRRVLGAANPWFIASMGASALLLFAIPASPLAQPWAIIGGNLVSALIGVSCASWIDSPGLAAGLSVALAIGAMYPLRCLHPPGGAVAITAALGGAAVSDLGYRFVAFQVLLNSLLLTILALLINNLAGRSFPHRVPHVPGHLTTDRPPSERVGVSRADLHAVLAERGELMDISEDDLQEILLQAEMRAHGRRFGALRCADFTAHDVVTIDANSTCTQALAVLQRHRISALPVTNAAGQLTGIVTLLDLLLPPDHTLTTPADRSAKVQQVMTTDVISARPDDLIEKLVAPFSDGGRHHMPVLDASRRVIGMVTQADLIAALFRAHFKN
ncbi:MAG: HPP family protein [Rhodoferax sp.]|nr:HPP family protein [Rhodoferax sp.]